MLYTEKKRAWGLLLFYAMSLPAIQELRCSHKTCETSVCSGNGVSKAIINKNILEKSGSWLDKLIHVYIQTFFKKKKKGFSSSEVFKTSVICLEHSILD